MLLGGGYYGQRLNKIYRGRAKFPYHLALYSDPRGPIFLLRERDGARNPSHSRANDQTVRPREAGWRTLWRFRDTCWLYITRDGGKGMVRRHGWGGTISRDCRVISHVSLSMRNLTSPTVNLNFQFSLKELTDKSVRATRYLKGRGSVTGLQHSASV